MTMTTYSIALSSFAALLIAAAPFVCEAGTKAEAGATPEAGLTSQLGQHADPECVGATNRPLSDFLEAQGTLNDPPLFFPPVKDYVGWTDKKPTLFALVDYAGLANEYLRKRKPPQTRLSLDTNVAGYVKECHLADGKALVSVSIFTTKALAFAQTVEALASSNFDFDNTPTFFGLKAQDVTTPADAAVGSANLNVSFTIEMPGGPLPDLVDVLVANTPAYAPANFTFSSSSFGECSGPSGAGRAARLDVQQAGETNKKGVLTFDLEIVEVVEADGGNCRD
jgi:hypothetical protein